MRLIEEQNPFWEDLAVSILGFEPLPGPPKGVIPAKHVLSDAAGGVEGAGTHEPEG